MGWAGWISFQKIGFRVGVCLSICAQASDLFPMGNPKKGTEAYARKLEQTTKRKQKQRVQAFVKKPLAVALVKKCRAQLARTRTEEQEKGKKLAQKIANRYQQLRPGMEAILQSFCFFFQKLRGTFRKNLPQNLPRNFQDPMQNFRF